MKKIYLALRTIIGLSILAVLCIQAPMKVSAQSSDLAITITPIANPSCGNTTQNVNFNVINDGPDIANMVTINILLNGNHIPGSPFLSPSIPSGTNLPFSVPLSFPKPGKNTIVASISATSPVDPDLSDNTATQTFNILFNGTYTVGSLASDHFSSIKMAVDTLNTYALCGATVIQVAAGHVENNVNIQLNATGTAVNTLEIVGMGTPKPIIKSLSTGSGTNNNAGFLSFGDAFFKINGGDYITITGIDLNEEYSGSDPTLYMEYGYMIARATATDGAKNCKIRNCTIQLNRKNLYTAGIFQSNYTGSGAVTNPASIAGLHEGNSYSGNVLSNMYNGIILRGCNVVSPYDLYDQTTNVGGAGRNIISNFGGGNQMASGIYVSYQNKVNISNDSINGGDSTSVSLFGIYLVNGFGANATVYNNKIILKPYSSTLPSYAIANSLGSSVAGNRITINQNYVESMVNSQATTAAMYGIYNNSNADTLYIYDNVVTGLSTTGSGGLSGIDAGSPLHTYVYGNTVSSLFKTGAGSLYGMRCWSGVVDAHNNTINNLNSSATSSMIYGIYNTAGPTSETYYLNTIRNLNHSGQGMVTGINLSNASALRIVRDNEISHLFSADSNVMGMYIGSGKATIYRNRIFDLQTSSPGTKSYAAGIMIYTGNKSEIYNNFISELKAPNANLDNAIRGIYLSQTAGDTTFVFYNSIFINAASSGATFGSTGVYFANNAKLDLRNNIIVNTSVPNGTANTSVLYSGNAGTSNYQNSSNNNCLYAGTPSSKNVIFANTGATDQTIAAFKARMTPRDSSSFTENVPFINATAAPYDLHISLSIPTLCASGGLRITSPLAITSDYDNDIRYGETGYSGTGTAPDVGADEGNYTRLDYDIAVISIDKPTHKGCFTASDTVAATIKNVTLKTIDFAVTPVTFTSTINNGSTLQTFNLLKNSGRLKPDSTIRLTFTTAAVMNVHGTYAIKVYHQWAADQVRTNDTLKITRIVTNPEIQSITADDTVICKWSPANLLATVSAFGGGSSQLTFSRDTAASIPDPGSISSSILVSGAGGQASDLVSVTIDSLLHTYDSDVDIYLYAPDGSRVELTTDNGSTGDNYLRTQFSTSAVNSISTGFTPFTGLFLPEESFEVLTGGVNGTWRLVVTDDNSGNSGTLYKWSIKVKAPNAIATYTWTPSASLSAQGIANPVATPVLTTTYHLTAVDQNGCSSIADSIKIYVNPAYRDTVDYQLCNGDSLYTQGAWQHLSGYYTDNNPTLLGCDSITVRHLNVHPVYNDTLNVTICLGDSSFAAGAWQHTAGLYLDHRHTLTYGCDSLTYTNLIVNPSYHDTLVIHICNGDSVFAAGAWQHSTGNYLDNKQTVLGCDSITWTYLTVNTLPVVNLGHDTLLCWDLDITLDAGNPGSLFLWSDGETGQTNLIDSAEYWLGSHDIWVQVNNGCIKRDTIRVSFTPCSGVDELQTLQVEIYPNPTNDKVFIRQLSQDAIQQYAVYDSKGLLLQQMTNTASMSDLFEIDLSAWPTGLYYIRLFDGKQNLTVPVVRVSQ